jgi:hypothetical protein
MDWRAAAWASDKPLRCPSFRAPSDRRTRETSLDGVQFSKLPEELIKARTADQDAKSSPRGEDQKPGEGSIKDDLVVSDPSPLKS